MFHSRWRRMPLLLVLPAAAVISVTGCGNSGSQAPGAGPTARPAGVVARTAPFSAAKLRGALLTRVNGVSAAISAESGRYSSLPEVRATRRSARNVSVTPKTCSRATVTGFNTAVVGAAPAAAVTFRVGRNGVSEVLVAPSGPAAASALGSRLPAECAHYRATIDGRTFRYTVREFAVKGIGEQARVLNVRTAGYPADSIWSIVYRGSGFVGAVTVVGPNASEMAARELGQQAYAYAAKSLS